MGTAEESRCDFYSAAVVNAKRVSPNTNPAEEVKGCAAVGGDGGGATDEDEDGRHDEPDDTEIGAEDIEEPPIRVAKSPRSPTSLEIDNHNTTHTPHRSWCPICIQGRGKEDAHKRQDKDHGGKPVVSADYKSFGHDEDDDKITVIILKDEDTGLMSSHRCDRKGASDGWVIDQIKDDIDNMGHTEVIFKTDGEPSIIQVQEKVQELRSHRTIPQNPPAYNPQSNGCIERAVQEFMNTMRVLKLGLEQRLQTQMTLKWNVIDWMIEHCSNIINHCLATMGELRTPG